MKKTLRNIIYSLILLFAVNSCKQNEQASYTQMGWSSSNPLSIPLKNRMQKHLMGNLVPNSSFETGRFFSFDSTDLTFNLNDWKKVGENVEWVNTRVDSIYSKNEVSEGFHAIKITRNKANETDEQGSGVVSGFIKVIPGNYNFSFDVRLENIKSNTERMGTKIYDAIDVRVFFFDKNKIQMPGEQFCTPLNSKIDISFKGASFSHFWQIKKFGWARVEGHSYHFPFNEGDIPDDAKYVKIFMGLKGTGKMWIDNVEYKYSNKNFTILERTICYKDSVFTPDKYITPTPQFTFPKDTIALDSRIHKKIYILLPDEKNKITSEAGQIIKNKIDKALAGKNLPEAEIVTSLSKNEFNKGNIIFSLGKTPLLLDYFNEIPVDKIKNKKQGYIIKCITKSNNVVVVFANEDIGILYAANTISQLISEQDAFYYDATIIDFPDYTKRSLSVNSYNKNKLNSSIRFLDKYKINSFYFNLDEFSDELDESEITTNEFGFILQKNKVGQINSLHSKYKKSIIITESKNKGFGIDTIFNDPIISQLFEKEQNRIKNIIQKFKDATILFEPMYKNNEEIINSNYLSRSYFEKISSAKKLKINYLWNGRSTLSNSFDMAELELFKEISGQYPVFLDKSFLISDSQEFVMNKYLYYPFKLKIGYLLQPYRTNIPNSYGNISPTHEIIAAINLNKTIQQYRIATYADFCWNSKAYNPYFSLMKILVHELGKNGAENVLYFYDAYVSLAEICILLENEKMIQKTNKYAEQYIIDLNIRFNSCKSNFPENTELIEELKLLKEKLVERYHKLYELNLVKQKLEKDSNNLITNIEDTKNESS